MGFVWPLHTQARQLPGQVRAEPKEKWILQFSLFGVFLSETSWFSGINLRIDIPWNRKAVEPSFPCSCRWTVTCLWWEALPLWLFPSFVFQVFGQTPFYTVENAQWSLWPEIPHDMVSKILEWRKVCGGGRRSWIWSATGWGRRRDPEDDWKELWSEHIEQTVSIQVDISFFCVFPTWASDAGEFFPLYSNPWFTNGIHLSCPLWPLGSRCLEHCVWKNSEATPKPERAWELIGNACHGCGTGSGSPWAT